jgi:hypothetical protein
MPVLHLVRIMPSYTMKTINSMHTKINTAAVSFFQNPALDCESNPHAILIRIWFF